MLNKKSKLRLLFRSLFVSLGSVKTDEGIQLLWEPETELMVGYDVYIEQENEDGDLEYIPAPNGEYKSGNTTFVIEDGKCTEIRNEEPEAETEAKAETSEENLEQPAEEPAQEEPAQEEPEFNAEQAISDLRAEYDAKFADLTQQVADMRVQLDALLALPAEENAFEKESKDETQKALFKSHKN